MTSTVITEKSEIKKTVIDEAKCLGLDAEIMGQLELMEDIGAFNTISVDDACQLLSIYDGDIELVMNLVLSGESAVKKVIVQSFQPVNRRKKKSESKSEDSNKKYGGKTNRNKSSTQKRNESVAFQLNDEKEENRSSNMGRMTNFRGGNRGRRRGTGRGGAVRGKRVFINSNIDSKNHQMDENDGMRLDDKCEKMNEWTSNLWEGNEMGECNLELVTNNSNNNNDNLNEDDFSMETWNEKEEGGGGKREEEEEDIREKNDVNIFWKGDDNLLSVESKNEEFKSVVSSLMHTNNNKNKWKSNNSMLRDKLYYRGQQEKHRLEDDNEKMNNILNHITPSTMSDKSKKDKNENDDDYSYNGTTMVFTNTNGPNDWSSLSTDYTNESTTTMNTSNNNQSISTDVNDIDHNNRNGNFNNNNNNIGNNSNDKFNNSNNSNSNNNNNNNNNNHHHHNHNHNHHSNISSNTISFVNSNISNNNNNNNNNNNKNNNTNHNNSGNGNINYRSQNHHHHNTNNNNNNNNSCSSMNVNKSNGQAMNNRNNNNNNNLRMNEPMKRFNEKSNFQISHPPDTQRQPQNDFNNNNNNNRNNNNNNNNHTTNVVTQPNLPYVKFMGSKSSGEPVGKSVSSVQSSLAQLPTKKTMPMDYSPRPIQPNFQQQPPHQPSLAPPSSSSTQPQSVHNKEAQFAQDYSRNNYVNSRNNNNTNNNNNNNSMPMNDKRIGPPPGMNVSRNRIAMDLPPHSQFSPNQLGQPVSSYNLNGKITNELHINPDCYPNQFNHQHPPRGYSLFPNPSHNNMLMIPNEKFFREHYTQHHGHILPMEGLNLSDDLSPHHTVAPSQIPHELGQPADSVYQIFDEHLSDAKTKSFPPKSNYSKDQFSKKSSEIEIAKSNIPSSISSSTNNNYMKVQQPSQPMSNHLQFPNNMSRNFMGMSRTPEDLSDDRNDQISGRNMNNHQQPPPSMDNSNNNNNNNNNCKIPYDFIENTNYHGFGRFSTSGRTIEMLNQEQFGGFPTDANDFHAIPRGHMASTSFPMATMESEYGENNGSKQRPPAFSIHRQL
ncbi:hypothetical protein SNEBB_011195 [Seison nebaliae]|nr:hypothetical protein SNEBB_011195 [Seison nebaliae]